MDGQALYVDEIFGQYLSANPPPEGVQPIPLLDLYQCHMMASVMSRIKAVGIHVIHIPNGCTGLTQPLDVSINQSFKACCHRIREDWLALLLDMMNKVHNMMHKEVSEWAMFVYWELVGLRILQNSSRRTGFDWLQEEASMVVGCGGCGHSLFCSMCCGMRAWLGIPSGIPENSGEFPIPDPFSTQFF
jgi:hypothetical protein